jgi:hypothetical protein
MALDIPRSWTEWVMGFRTWSKRCIAYHRRQTAARHLL